MAKHNYTSDTENINLIKLALQKTLQGVGFKQFYDISIKRNRKDFLTISFETKESGKELNPMEFLAFGIIIGRDFHVKEKKSQSS